MAGLIIEYPFILALLISMARVADVSLGTFRTIVIFSILLDAPCSGEGTVRKDADALKNWSIESNIQIAQVQKDLIKSAFYALKPGGTITLEFPHLMRLLEYAQFDTVYHEHFSYLSLLTVSRIFAKAGLRVWHAEEVPTHGGSLRIYGGKNNAINTQRFLLK